MDAYTVYAMVATSEAMHDSGINLENINLDKAGVIWASGIGGLDRFTKYRYTSRYTNNRYT